MVGVTLGVIDGVTEGVIDGVTEGVIDGVTLEIIEDVGVIDGVTEGVTVGVSDGVGVGVGFNSGQTSEPGSPIHGVKVGVVILHASDMMYLAQKLPSAYAAAVSTLASPPQPITVM